jgi:DNA-directed RNA polymerase subunit RPC12/RpoP
MITFACSACQKTLGVRDEYAGKQVRCPGCGRILIAPAAASARPAVAVAEAPPATAKPAAAVQETRASDAGVSGDLNTVYAPAKHAPAQNVAAPIGTALGLETRYTATERERHDPALVDFLGPAQAVDEIGRLGRYRILRILGRGGMGIVFQAEDTMQKRPVALKAIRPALAVGEESRKRFLREGRAMARLQHEHVVRLYEVNEESGVPYIVMELLTGDPLHHRLLREGLLPPAETLRIGREVAEVLAVAHAEGMIHRDIKPENIFLEGSAGRVKLLDFGLVSAIADDSRLTQTGDVMGTPAYMSPEQGRGDKVDCRCDLFSLGVVLYRMSTGKEPFTGAGPLETITAAARETPPAPRMLNAAVPADLSDLIMRLLEKSPNRRGTAQEAVDALTRIERGEPMPAPAPTPAQPAPPVAEFAELPPEIVQSPSPPRSGSGTLLALLIGGVLAALLMCIGIPLLIVVYLFFR